MLVFCFFLGKKSNRWMEDDGWDNKLKGLFNPLLNPLPTMQEIIKGDQKKGGNGTLQTGRHKEGGRMAGERKKERRRRRVNITSLCQANMGCWDPSTKSLQLYGREKGEKRRGRKRNQQTSIQKLGNGKWKYQAADNWLDRDNLSCCSCVSPCNSCVVCLCATGNTQLLTWRNGKLPYMFASSKARF